MKKILMIIVFCVFTLIGINNVQAKTLSIEDVSELYKTDFLNKINENGSNITTVLNTENSTLDVFDNNLSKTLISFNYTSDYIEYNNEGSPTEDNVLNNLQVVYYANKLFEIVSSLSGYSDYAINNFDNIDTDFSNTFNTYGYEIELVPYDFSKDETNNKGTFLKRLKISLDTTKIKKLFNKYGISVEKYNENYANFFSPTLKIGESKKNAYQEKSSNYPNNRYCKVYCTEDYTYTMPGVDTTTSRGYIKGLTTHIKGNKTCYTTEIDTAEFENYLEVYRKRIIEAWNEWNRWYMGEKADVLKSTKSRTGCCNNSKYEAISYYKTWDYETYDVYGNSRTKDYEMSSLGTIKCNCNVNNDSCTGNCVATDGSPVKLEQSIGKKLSSAQHFLYKLINIYNEIIKEYNSCSSSITQDSIIRNSNSTIWKMNYNFAPSIDFIYKNNSINIPESNTLFGSGTSSGLNIQVCDGSMDSNYNCENEWKSYSYSNSYNTKAMFTCYSASSSRFACEYIPVNIATAKYVKQTMTGSGVYYLPSQYYLVYKHVDEPTAESTKKEVLTANDVDSTVDNPKTGLLIPIIGFILIVTTSLLCLSIVKKKNLISKI